MGGRHYGRTAAEFCPTKTKIGRFISRDPIGFAAGDLNLYRYVRNSPIHFRDPHGLIAPHVVFAIGGAVVGLAGQGIADLISGEVSDWEEYAGAAVGGAVTGVTLLHAGPTAAGAAGGAASSFVTQGLYSITEDRDFDFEKLAVETGMGALFGKILPSPSISGVTAGRGSMLAIYRSHMTRLGNKPSMHVSLKAALKMFAGRSVETMLLPGMIGGEFGSGLYYWLKSLLLQDEHLCAGN